MLAMIIIVILIAQASSDALFFLKKKRLSKLIECLYIALFLILPVFLKSIDFHYMSALILFYLFARLAIYDIVFNLTAGLSINYVGNTSYIYDDFISKLKNWEFWVFKIGFGLIALVIYIKILS